MNQDELREALGELEATFVQLAPIIFVYFKRLTSEGFEDEQALALTRDFQTHLVGGVGRAMVDDGPRSSLESPPDFSEHDSPPPANGWDPAWGDPPDTTTGW